MLSSYWLIYFLHDKCHHQFIHKNITSKYKTKTGFWQALYDTEPNKSKKNLTNVYDVNFPMALCRTTCDLDISY